MVFSNDNKIELPITEPPITSYPYIANTLAILLSYKQKTLPWFSDRFAQIVMSKDFSKNYDLANFYDVRNPNKINFADYSPFLSTQRIDSSVKNIIDDFKEFVINQIDNGYYIHLSLNENELDSSLRNSDHQIFLYGYDKENKKILINYYDINRKYIVGKYVDYEKINNSYENRVIKDRRLLLWKYTDYDYSINLDLLNLYLRDYINATDSLPRCMHLPKYKPTYNFSNEYVLGLDFYDNLIQHCSIWKNGIELKSLHVLCEHKLVMKIRLEYLHSINIISMQSYEKISSICDSLIKHSIFLRNLGLKYKIAGSDEMLAELIEGYSNLKDLDRNFTKELIFLLN